MLTKKLRFCGGLKITGCLFSSPKKEISFKGSLNQRIAGTSIKKTKIDFVKNI